MHKKARGLEYKLHIYTVDFRTPYVIISLVKKFYVRGEYFEKIINRHMYFSDSISGMPCGCMGSWKRWDRIWCAGVALYPFCGPPSVCCSDAAGKG